jgi:probable selenium-dependent hydroxylase accessory protein YqeC
MPLLAAQLGLNDREVVAIVGGGGKSTLLFNLGNELSAAGRRVVLTTTTKMGRDQVRDLPSVSWSVESARAATKGPGPVMLVTGGDDHKVTGPAPNEIDRLFRTREVDFIVVEADGAHGRPLKAPASHEPVVPRSTTTMVITMGIDAVGLRIDDAVHRVEQAALFTGQAPDRILTPEDCATILAHPDGALRVAPRGARVVVALTKVHSEAAQVSAGRIRGLLEGVPAIDDIVAIQSAP